MEGEEGARKVGRGQTVKDPVCCAKGLGQQAMGNRGLEDFIKWSNKIKTIFYRNHRDMKDEKQEDKNRG